MINNTTKDLNSLIKNLALNYVAKYYTTSYKLSQYLQKKLIKLNIYSNACNDIINNIITDFKEKNYINDQNYSNSKTISLVKKGKSNTYIKHMQIQNKLPNANVSLSTLDCEILSALIYTKKRKLACFATTNLEEKEIYKHKQKLYSAGFSVDVINTIFTLNLHQAIDKTTFLLNQLNTN